MLDYFKGTVTPKDWMFCGVVGAVALLLWAGYYFVLHRMQQERLDGPEGLVKKIEAKKAELVVAENLKKDFEGLQAKSQAMKDLVTTFEQERMPSQREILPLIRTFEAEGKAMGVDPEIKGMPTSSADEEKETYQFLVKAYGNFNKIVGFINKLERNKRYLKVADIDIKEGNDKALVQAQFYLYMYRFKSKEEASVQGGGEGEKEAASAKAPAKP